MTKQTAGVSGWSNAGVEVGKLVSNLVSAIASGIGIAKIGASLTEKIVAKVVSKVDSTITAGVPYTQASLPLPDKLSAPTGNWQNTHLQKQ